MSVRRAWARSPVLSSSASASHLPAHHPQVGGSATKPLKMSIRRRMRALPLMSRVPSAIGLKAIDTTNLAACCPVGVDMFTKPKEYNVLAKSKLTTFVAISALPGYVIAAPAIDPSVVACLFVGTALSSGAAQTMNQMLEVEYDKLMNRTRGRPLPRGKVSLEHAGVFATVGGMTGASLLAVGTTPATAVLGTSIAALYAGLYTPMKRVTPYNTHVGAIAGSLPVLMGFAAAGAPIYCPQAVMLFALQTLWQFPHFYCLAWLYRADYSKANYKMFPLGDETGKYTADIIKPYNAALMALPTVSCLTGATTWMFAVDSILPNVFFAQRFFVFAKDPSPQTARSFFFASLWHLGAMLALFTLHSKEVDETRESAKWRQTLREVGGKLACAHHRFMESWTTPGDLCPIFTFTESKSNNSCAIR